ncbi:MAG: hypothetical protein A2016_08360 [Elusimicrobia bacterium GWF2_62_30]|nr:MAG: hypothetical protein A2016_08360 [Elusimicrobia bacterium GWF2_62_30]
MLFCVNKAVPLRLRMLLGFIIAAGAGILLMYFSAKRALEPLSVNETGEQLYSSVKVAATEINSGIIYAQEKALLIASGEELRALLASPPAPGKEEALKAALSRSTKFIPGLSAAALTDKRGATLAVFSREGSRVSTETGKAFPGAGEIYIAPPIIAKDDLIYEVALPLALNGNTKPRWALSCRFSVIKMPRILPPPSCPKVTVQLAKRKGEKIVISSADGKRTEEELRAETAALFLPVLQGKEGYSADNGGTEPLVYSYARLQSPDWLIVAKAAVPQHAASRARKALAQIRVQAFIQFAALSLAAFLFVKLMSCPVSENAAAAAALLEELGAAPPADAGACSETETIAKALAEALSRFKTREESGLQLRNEAEKLREEDEELKNQNVELEKLNKYLLERESKISELKAELRELQEKVDRVKGE